MIQGALFNVKYPLISLIGSGSLMEKTMFKHDDE